MGAIRPATRASPRWWPSRLQPPVPPNWKPNGYLERLPKDPWGNPINTSIPGCAANIDVFSFGADGAPGGTGFDADIGSWDL